MQLDGRMLLVATCHSITITYFANKFSEYHSKCILWPHQYRFYTVTCIIEWRQEELLRINETLAGAERKAALCMLLDQETQLLASIGRHKLEADADNREKFIQEFLEKVSSKQVTCFQIENDLGLSLFVPSVFWHCWLGGRRGIRPVKNWVVGCWHGYLSGARCRLAYGPADAAASHCLLLQ